MISISRLVFGILFVVGGFALTIVSFFTSLFFLIYSIPMVVVGIWMLANKNEDKIEERKDIKVRGAKK